MRLGVFSDRSINNQGGNMSIVAWIILGLVAGWIASKIMQGSGSGLVTNLVLGIVGAFVGGILFNAVGGTGITGFNIWSVIVAVIGAVVVLWVYNAVTSRRSV
jgi:uncharacterized membrane protein YeaQ/YmgE (transglycosylase-associated protein family)